MQLRTSPELIMPQLMDAKKAYAIEALSSIREKIWLIAGNDQRVKLHKSLDNREFRKLCARLAEFLFDDVEHVTPDMMCRSASDICQAVEGA